METIPKTVIQRIDYSTYCCEEGHVVLKLKVDSNIMAEHPFNVRIQISNQNGVDNINGFKIVMLQVTSQIESGGR